MIVVLINQFNQWKLQVYYRFLGFGYRVVTPNLIQR